MKVLVLPALVTLVFVSCQKQYFTSCPEIDLIKKGNAAYLAGDWETFKSCYGDTARIWDNSFDMTKGITPDQYIESMKSSLAGFASYTISDGAIYEMIVTDDGQHWVHNWFEWRGITKAGKEIVSPVNVSFRVEGGKVQWQFDVYDALPMHLATQADSTQIP